MKENKILKFTGLVMFVSVIAVVLVAGTYAKYTSSASGSSTAFVAKWSILLNGDDITLAGSPENLEFNLFDTIYDSDGINEEGNVAPGKIAPGTSGVFNFDLKNESEVNAEYTIEFTLTDDENQPIELPLQFSLDGDTWGDLENITAQPLNMNEETTATVQWKWAYERTDKDAEDTALGIDASAVKVKAKIVVSQKD